MIPGAEERLGRRSDPEEYPALKLHVLERDGWKCQTCGRRDQLEVHHQILRSQLGADDAENLITLCHGCHRQQHEVRDET